MIEILLISSDRNRASIYRGLKPHGGTVDDTQFKRATAFTPHLCGFLDLAKSIWELLKFFSFGKQLYRLCCSSVPFAGSSQTLSNHVIWAKIIVLVFFSPTTKCLLMWHFKVDLAVPRSIWEILRESKKKKRFDKRKENVLEQFFRPVLFD